MNWFLESRNWPAKLLHIRRKTYIKSCHGQGMQTQATRVETAGKVAAPGIVGVKRIIADSIKIDACFAEDPVDAKRYLAEYYFNPVYALYQKISRKNGIK